MKLNQEEIKKLIPHRDPFLYLDTCIINEVGVSGEGFRKFSENEFFFKGHFPNMPIVPGVILIEALAQTAGILSFKSMDVLPDKNSLYYFVGIDNCRFKNPVLPGDTLLLEVEIDRVRGGVWKYHSVARVQENICAEATILCALKKV